ncbi:MAG: flagellar biosynthetic protein FliR [Lentisphaerae bacterium RIFOXYA12_FULL_48_11]|nr:MAG: flagellar biosynthetic protein FliR [Lentisphaerae bacterium RIFOXYA12_FULL_48_11]
MELNLEFYPQAVILLFSRMASLLISLPFFGGSQVPAPMKMGIAFAMSVVLFPQLSPEWISMAGQINTFFEMFIAMLNEILIGAGMGLLCNAFLAACTLAGNIIGMDTGLSMAQAMDPVNGVSGSILSSIIQYIGILMVLILGGHLVLMKILVVSLQTCAVPMQWLNDGFIMALVSTGKDMFLFGLKLALPVVCISLLMNVCFGLISRLAPDFDILFLSLPVRLGIGLAVFGLTLRFAGGVFEGMIEAMLNRCGAVFAG